MTQGECLKAAETLEQMATAPAFFNDSEDDRAWRQAALAGAAALRRQPGTSEAHISDYERGRINALSRLASALKKVLSPELIALIEAEARRELSRQYSAASPASDPKE